MLETYLKYFQQPVTKRELARVVGSVAAGGAALRELSGLGYVVHIPGVRGSIPIRWELTKAGKDAYDRYLGVKR